MKFLEYFRSRRVVLCDDVFGQITDPHHRFGFHPLDENPRDLGAYRNHHFVKNKRRRLEHIGRIRFELLLNLAIFAKIILLIRHHQHMAVDAKHLVAKDVLKTTCHGNDRYEGHHSQKHPANRNDRDDRQTNPRTVEQVS